VEDHLWYNKCAILKVPNFVSEVTYNMFTYMWSKTLINYLMSETIPYCEFLSLEQSQEHRLMEQIHY